MHEGCRRVQDFSYALRKFRKDCKNFAILAKFRYAQFFSMIVKFRYHSENYCA